MKTGMHAEVTGVLLAIGAGLVMWYALIGVGLRDPLWTFRAEGQGWRAEVTR